MEADGDLDQVGSRRYSGKWSDSGYILNVEQTSVCWGIRRWVSREKSEGWYQYFGPKKLEGWSFHLLKWRRLGRRRDLPRGWGTENSDWYRRTKPEMSIRYPRGFIEQAAGMRGSGPGWRHNLETHQHTDGIESQITNESNRRILSPKFLC